MPVLFNPLSTPTNLIIRITPTTDFGKNPMFNFDTGEFYLNPDGTFIIRDDKSGLTNLVRKILNTPRSTFLIYTQDYGCEIERLLGQNYTAEENKLEIARMIREALIYDQRIKSVEDFEIIISNDKAYVNFSYTDIWNTTQRLEVIY